MESHQQSTERQRVNQRKRQAGEEVGRNSPGSKVKVSIEYIEELERRANSPREGSKRARFESSLRQSANRQANTDTRHGGVRDRRSATRSRSRSHSRDSRDSRSQGRSSRSASAGSRDSRGSRSGSRERSLRHPSPFVERGKQGSPWPPGFMQEFMIVTRPLKYACAALWVSKIAGYSDWATLCTPGDGNCASLEHIGEHCHRNQNKTKVAAGEIDAVCQPPDPEQVAALTELLLKFNLPASPPR